LKRALRVDKMRLAALEAVLRLYSDPDRLRSRLPTLAWLTRPRDEIEHVAKRVLAPLQTALHNHAEVCQVECRSQIGSGSLPVDLLPSVGVALRPLEGGRRSGRHVERLAAAFRKLPIPVVGRIQDGALLFDLRTLDDPRLLIDQLDQLALGPASTATAKQTRVQPPSTVSS